MTSNPRTTPPVAPAHILVVDDEPDLRTLYELTLLREGHNVSVAGSLAEARELLAQRRFDVVITDMRLPDGTGLELLRELANARRPERSIVITAYGSAENAVESLKHGAFDYLTKPVDLKQFRTVVRAAQTAPTAMATTQRFAMATSGSVSLPDAPSVEVPREGRPDPNAARPAAALSPAERALARLVGDSPIMQAVKARIAKVARSMAPVLVCGESGTGKELVARALHDCSHRADGPFVPVNCGAIPENLLEAEFFGARKGSYTGATQDRQGFFQAARDGTLFLDEIGDLPLAMQAKLLRAIQERHIRPLGDPQEQAVDVRFVSATHKNLAAEVQAGRFRQDLYYRLNVIEIVIPPLRERRADLPLLARTLLARIAAETGLPAPEPSPRLLAQLQAAPLPGNVRELENILHRAVALGDADDLDSMASSEANPFAPTGPAPLRDALTDLASLPHDLQAWIDAQERRVLLRALEQTGFNRAAAAARLGLNLRQIRSRIARLGITTRGNGANNADEHDGSTESHDDGA